MADYKACFFSGDVGNLKQKMVKYVSDEEDQSCIMKEQMWGN